MSDKDDVKKAAIEALSRPSKRKKSNGTKSSKSSKGSRPVKKAEKSAKKASKSVKKSSSTPAPEKGSAEAEVHKQAAKAKSVRLSEPERPVPQKGGAEAAVHNMASRAAGGNTSGPDTHKNEGGTGFGFLFLVLLLPLAIIGGLYAYATYVQEKDTRPAQMASNKTSEKDSGGKTASPATSQKPAKNEKSASASGKTAPTGVAASTPKAAAGTTNPAGTTPVVTKTAKVGSEKIHWDYKSVNWATLDPAFKTCGEGRSQSPIDIRVTSGAAGPNFHFNYFPTNGKVVNTGHSIQVDLTKSATNAGNQLLVNGKAYELKQFHFHTPGENRINGRSFPMEVHLVHKNAQGQLAIVAIMIAAGAPNQLIDRMPVPASKGDFAKSGGAHINPALLLPNDRRSFTFTGSLTTPPCTQDVGWIVLKSPLAVSPATLAKFQKTMGKNNRPVQPVNSRTIFNSN